MNLLNAMEGLAIGVRVLHVGAHPDDEEIGLLSYISFKHHIKPVYWSATRGESGQNRINGYQGDALGIFRTWESLAARELDGGECLFGPFVDFGFSKNAEEAFSKWGRETVIQELVRAIRIVQPQVIISRWTGKPDDGHGHHQAVGLALREAFALADRPDAFPELLEVGLYPWRPSKYYFSTNKGIFPSGRINPLLEDPHILKINTGEYCPFLGRTYQEQAWTAYNAHQTQGIDRLPSPGDFYYYLIPHKTSAPDSEPEGNLLDGLDADLTGLFSGVAHVETMEGIRKVLKEAGERVREAIEVFNGKDPLPSSGPLLKALETLKKLNTDLGKMPIDPFQKGSMGYSLKRRIAQFEEVIGQSLGLRLEAFSTRGRVTPGESLWLRTTLWNFRHLPIEKVVFTIKKPDTCYFAVEEGMPNKAAGDITETADGFMMIREIFIGNDAELTSPYWLKGQDTCHVHEPDPIYPMQDPLSEALISVNTEIIYKGHSISLSCPAVKKNGFPGGYRGLPVAVVPPISLHPEYDKKILLVKDKAQEFSLKVTARCNDEEQPSQGHLELRGPRDWHIEPSFVDINLRPVDGAQTCSFTVTMPARTPEAKNLLLYIIRCRERDYNTILTPVRKGAPGLPHADDAATCVKEEFILRPSTVAIQTIDAHHLAGQRYAYIEGAKEAVIESFRPFGIDIHPLDGHNIGHGDLLQYHGIIIGPNGYLLNTVARDNAHRLLDYVRKGGRLIVQYQGYGYQKAGFAPYPFTYSIPHDRVTDETAPVTILQPDDPIFHSPNIIGSDDFNGWIHDRGLYFFGQWDEKYRTLLSCADPGEIQKPGGLMTCRYGEGTYVYVAYSLFRQIPQGVPGAWRLFLNIISSHPQEGSTP